MMQPQPHSMPSGSARPRIGLTYDVEEDPERWLLEEETMPESPLHDQVIDHLRLLVHAWIARTRLGRAYVARNVACRWDPNDARIGMDPDLVLLDPCPQDIESIKLVKIWEIEPHSLKLAIEVVSETTAEKDYTDAPARCVRLGIAELWVFDPRLTGPTTTGGPFRLQVWRLEEGQMRRVYMGPGPAHSQALDAWLVVTDGGRRLRIANDRLGQSLWLTQAEEQFRRAETEARRAETEARRAETEAKRAETEAGRAETEAKRANEAERQLAELLLELAALKKT
jgi:Uma2 family endonuclease